MRHKDSLFKRACILKHDEYKYQLLSYSAQKKRIHGILNRSSLHKQQKKTSITRDVYDRPSVKKTVLRLHNLMNDRQRTGW